MTVEFTSPPRSARQLRIALAVASAVVLGWHSQAALRGIGTSDSVEQTYTLMRALGPRNPEAQADELWLHRMMIDGRHVPLEEIDRAGPWEALPYSLALRSEDESASLRITGRQVTPCFITSPWSGVVSISNDRGVLGTVDLFHEPSDRTTFACIEVAGGEVGLVTTSDDAGRSIFSWALLPVLVTLLLLRPWRSSPYLEAWAVVHVALLHVLVWLFMPIGYNSDSPEYVAGVGRLLTGEPSYFPPGYSLFLAPWTLLTPQWTGFLVAGVQHACMVLTLLWLRRMAARCMGEDLATLGLLLAGSVAPTLLLPQIILSENVALLGMVGALWFASRPGAETALRNDLIAGAFAGLATLARVVPLPALVVPLLLVHYSSRDRRASVLRTARVLSVTLVVLSIPVAWNGVRSGRFGLTTSTGAHMYNRVVTEQGLLDRDAAATRRFLDLMGDRPLERVEHQEIRAALTNLTDEEAMQLVGDVAWEGLRSQPVRFELYSIHQAWREYVAISSLEPWPSAVDLAPGLQSVMPARWHGASILWWAQAENEWGSLWRWLLWMPLAGLLALTFLEQRLWFVALLAVPAGYLFVTAHIEFFLPRYAVPVLPFALMLVPAPLAALGRALAVLRREPPLARAPAL